MDERQTDRREVDGEGEDDKRHDPEHGLHGSQVGVVETRLCTQLKRGPIMNSFKTLQLRVSQSHRNRTVLSDACWVKDDSPPG